LILLKAAGKQGEAEKQRSREAGKQRSREKPGSREAGKQGSREKPGSRKAGKQGSSEAGRSRKPEAGKVEAYIKGGRLQGTAPLPTFRFLCFSASRLPCFR
jgi:hypothetical protein